MKLTGTRITATAIILLSAATFAWAYPWGPPNHMTDAPGELNCTFCHDSFALNSGPGSVNISMIPEWGPMPEDTVEVRIDLQQAGQLRWGFEIAAVDLNGDPAPGEFILTDTARTQLSLDANGRTYIKHKAAGTDSGTVNIAPGWSFKWAVPRFLDLTVDFYVAANAANGDGTSSGDYIYTDSMQIRSFIDYFFTTGDVNEDGQITSADIIYEVGYVFKGGPEPLPCVAVGDVNCSGSVTSADVIYLVGYVFKGSYPPCDVIVLFPDTWWCY